MLIDCYNKHFNCKKKNYSLIMNRYWRLIISLFKVHKVLIKLAIYMQLTSVGVNQYNYIMNDYQSNFQKHQKNNSKLLLLI